MNDNHKQEESGENEKLDSRHQAYASLRTALAFLTLIPVGSDVRFDDDSIRHSILFYPVIGLLLGALSYFAASLMPFTAILNSALIVFLLVAVTGGLHLDGLADSTDAWFGGMGDKARTLEIMKDSHSGAMAAVSVSMLLIVKTAAVYEVLSTEEFALLILAPVLSRLSVLGLFMSTPYIGQGPIGKAIAASDPVHLYAVLIGSVVLCFFMIAQTSLILLLALVFGLALLLRKCMLARLQGFTGDCAGAQIELLEVFVLIGGSLVVS
jgi:adenosylcobinamide-GDP ribazoletransferase